MVERRRPTAVQLVFSCVRLDGFGYKAVGAGRLFLAFGVDYADAAIAAAGIGLVDDVVKVAVWLAFIGWHKLYVVARDSDCKLGVSLRFFNDLFH